MYNWRDGCTTWRPPRAVLLVLCSCAVADKESSLTLFGAFKHQLRKNPERETFEHTTHVDSSTCARNRPMAAIYSSSAAHVNNMKISVPGSQFCGVLGSEHVRAATRTSVVYLRGIVEP